MAGNLDNHQQLNDNSSRNITLKINNLSSSKPVPDKNIDKPIPDKSNIKSDQKPDISAKSNDSEKPIKSKTVKKKKSKKSKKRCSHPECRIKLKLTDMTCRCGNTYCSKHRYSESHNCTYDYKTLGRIQLESENPNCQFSKLDRI